MNKLSLKGHNILISAGSTWIPIDSVRVITNIFKGKIGLSIATLAAKLGANVTLLLGPSLDISNLKLSNNLNIIRFKYFDELDMLMQKTLKNGKFDTVIHSAAVSDFKLKKIYKGKIKSNVNKLVIELVPTKKIVDNIKEIVPSIFLIKFKLEVGISPEKLINVAFRSLQKSDADLIVANIYDKNFNDHEAYIIDPNKNIKKELGKENIAYNILNHVHDRK